MEQLAVLEKPRDEVALPGRAINGGKQIEQLVPVFSVFLERVFERKVL